MVGSTFGYRRCLDILHPHRNNSSNIQLSAWFERPH